MPINYRKMYLNEVIKAKKKEQDSIDSQKNSAHSQQSVPKGPSFNPKGVSSKGSIVKPRLPRTKK